MSTRQLRRLRNEDKNRQKNVEENEPEDFQPVGHGNSSTFAMLLLSSDEDSDAGCSRSTDPRSSESEGLQDEPTTIQAKKKSKKKSNKTKQNKPSNVDDVEWSVNEVNRILGEPSSSTEVKQIVDERLLQAKILFSISADHINVNQELAVAYGDKQGMKRQRQKGTRKMRHEIGLSPDVGVLQLKGLSMVLHKMEGDIKYFRFEHSADYQTRCRLLVTTLEKLIYTHDNTNPIMHLENCVEAFIENCDFLYKLEEHTSANKALERAISCMQSVGSTSFNFVDRKSRLPYLFVENRPFHIALLKYLHKLTNIACHRTALELAKVLLNLDPSDPLAVVFIIDTLALRAREFQWLIDLAEFWKDTRQADRLFHMRYSLALAKFQLARKHHDEPLLEEATAALKIAIKEFPPVVAKLLEYSKISVPNELKNHVLFGSTYAANETLTQLISIYAWMNVPRWREDKVWRWFIETLQEVTDAYDKDPWVKDRIDTFAQLSRTLYRQLPRQISRHMHVIKPMTKYILDNIPVDPLRSVLPTIASNPYPKDGPATDTYSYYQVSRTDPPSQPNALLAFMENIYPNVPANL